MDSCLTIPSFFSKCKYQLKHMTSTREENVTTSKNCILKEMGLKFQKVYFKILCEIAFWNKQKWLNKELIVWMGLTHLVDHSGKMINFICKKISDLMETSQPASIISGQPDKRNGPLQVGWSIKWDRMFF